MLFTAGIGNNDLCHAIIANIVAEGVETEMQVAFLKLQGDMAWQGYLFSKPLPGEDFKEWLRSASKGVDYFS